MESLLAGWTVQLESATSGVSVIAGLFRIWQEREPHITGVNEIVKIETLHVCKLRSLSSLLSCHGRPRLCETKASDVVPLVKHRWFPFPAVQGVPLVPIGCLSDVLI